MKKLQFNDVQFITSAFEEKHYPKFPLGPEKFLPEIAVVGRSNVGKSSLLNHLFMRKQMVKTSSVPGKTQSINFFKIDNQLVFADLPGYGYAKIPQSVKRNWGKMIETYLLHRSSLKGILFLLDIRHPPSKEDKLFCEWIQFHQLPFTLVLTKSDKLPISKRASQQKLIIQQLQLEGCYTIQYSAEKNLGRQELLKKIEHLLKDES